MSFALNRKTLTGLALLTASGPFAVDMYLPALPNIAAGLDTTQPLVQLTLTALMVGMALGQLAVGALSDAQGRHRLLIAGTAIAAVASVLCTVAPNVEVLIVSRFVHGIGSGAAVVLARTIVADLAEGRQAARMFSILMMIQGLAPVLAPIIGGVLLKPIGWRGLFWILAGLSVIQLLVVIFGIKETLPPQARIPSSIRGFFGGLVAVLKNRAFLGFALAFSFGFGGMFSYISASPFVIQEQLGMSAVIYSVIFAINSAGIILGSAVNTYLVKNHEPYMLLRNAVAVMVLGGVMIVAASFSSNPWLILPPLFIVVTGMGFIMGNATALGAGAVPERAGSGSAVMGFMQFLVAGLVSPLVGIGGDNPALAMGVGMAVCGVIALAGTLMAHRMHKAIGVV